MSRSPSALITRTDLRLALTAGLTGGLVVSLGLPDPFYGPMAVGAALGGTVGASRSLGLQRLLGTVLGGVALAVLHPTLSPVLPLPIGVALALATTRLLGGCLGLQSGYKVAGLVVAVGWTVHATTINSWVPIRLVVTLIGVLTAWLAIRCFWPSRAIDRRHQLSVQLYREFALALREQASLLRDGDGVRGVRGLERRNHLLGLILEHRNQRGDAEVECGGDRLAERLARLWDRQEQLWSELIACYRTLLRLPPLPRRHGSLAHLIEVEAALLEAAADRLETWAGCWPSPPPRHRITAQDEGDSLATAGRNLEAAEMGLFEDAEATALLLGGSGGRRAVACSQVLLALQGFEVAWRATP
jgi:uncharacterized membrane protein YccC